MKTIIKHGLVLGFLLLFAGNEKVVVYFEQLGFDLGRVFLLSLCISGTILFGISSYLKHENRRKDYNFVVGISIGAFISVIGAVLYGGLSMLIFILTAGWSVVVWLWVPRIVGFTFLGIFISLFIPLYYIRKKEEFIETESDILDEEFSNDP